MIAKRLITNFIVGCLSVSLLIGIATADVRVVLDVSKSMAENDPKNVRSDAIMVMLNALPNGDKAGIWTFGQYVNLLVPHEAVSERWRTDAQSKIRQLAAPAIRTNLGRALEEASYDFLFTTYRAPAHIVLITDGRVDIAPNSDVNGVERERILTQIIPKYVAANARIHTIAISDQADHALLKQLSQQTGGRYQRIDKPSTLSNVLADLTAEVSPTNRLKMVRESFVVDSRVRELTVLMYHSNGAVSLVAPDGKEYSAVKPQDQRWRVGEGFSQVSISSPLTGQWRVNGELTPGSKIQVLSDVTLEWSEPSAASVVRSKTLGIEAMLVDASGNNVAADLSSLVRAELRVDGVLTPLLIQGEKIVGRVVPQANAETLNIELTVNAGTFNRLITRQIRFVEPFISEVLLTAKGYEWRLYPNQLLMPAGNLQASAQYTVDGVKKSEPFTQAAAGYWVWKLPYEQMPGTYDVQLQGELMQGSGSMMLARESITLPIPPTAGSGFAMTPDASMEHMPIVDMNIVDTTGDAFIKDPMPMFEELQADLVVEQREGDPWSDEQSSTNSDDSSKLMTYLLLSIPGVLVLVAAYLFYRRLEQKTKGETSEEELILGGDEFSQLDDMNAIKPDSDLDISSFDDFDDEPMADAPVIDEVYEEDLPTPDKTEAPSIAQEDMLDETGDASTNALDDTEEDPEEELFDISSIDDDLADLDLALDGDDPFADDEPDDKP